MDAVSLHLALFSTILGSPDFNQREFATTYLKESPAHVASLLAHSYDPEVACRADRIARDNRRDWASSMAERIRPRQFHDRLPWIDGLNRAGDYGQTVYSYLCLARENPPIGGWTQWEEYRKATKMWLKDCLLDGVPVGELQRLLDICGEVECQWIAANKHNKGSLPPDIKED